MEEYIKYCGDYVVFLQIAEAPALRGEAVKK